MLPPSLKQFCFKSVRAVTLVTLALSLVIGMADFRLAMAQSMLQSLPPLPANPEDMLKPLVDTRQYDSEPSPSNLRDRTPLQGQAYRKLTPTSLTPEGQSQPAGGSSGSGGTKMLTGQVQTLQQAIASESNVDWYAWYLAAREYLGRMGGLECALGTPIKFYRSGRIEALTFNPICQNSVTGRMFPLPAKTRLDAVILPVRAGAGPPASPEEIYSRINGANGFR